MIAAGQRLVHVLTEHSLAHKTLLYLLVSLHRKYVESHDTSHMEYAYASAKMAVLVLVPLLTGGVTYKIHTAIAL